MSKKITNAIVEYISYNFGLFNNSKLSLRDPIYLLDKKILFTDSNELEVNCNVWGSECIINGSRFKVICTDLGTFDNEFCKTEFFIITQLDDCPVYGCFIEIDPFTGDVDDSKIMFALESHKWLNSNIFIQATFLAGIEQLSEAWVNWNQLTNYDDLFENIKSFIDIISNSEE